MRKIVLALGMFTCAFLNAHAQNTILFTTENDWTGWSGGWFGYTMTPVTTFDYDGVTVNGLGNTSAPGATGTGGSLQISPESGGWGAVAYGPGLTWAAMSALDGPGAVAPYSQPPSYGPGSLVARTGTLVMDYTIPQTSSYFQPGFYFQTDSQGWSTWFASSQIDLGPVTTPNGTMEMYRAFIPYSISACSSYTYNNFGIMQNSGAAGTTTWYIDNISAVPLITPPPITSLFTTADDFSTWSAEGGDMVLSDSSWSADSSTVNGLGNTTAAGATGTSGSLLINWSSLETGYGFIAYSPNEDGNAAFMQAIDPGCNTGSQTSVPAYGNIYVDYSQPDNSGGGSYFGFAMALSYAGNGYNTWGSIIWPTTKDLNMKDDNGDEVYQATFPYTINAGNYYGFSLNFFANSDFQPANGFHVDNISVSAASAPLITAASLNVTNMVIQGTNGLGGLKYAVLTSTNLAIPMSQWTAVSTNTFYGPTFNVTNPVDPASPSGFYGIRAPQQ
jgi:hypothetical protein